MERVYPNFDDVGVEAGETVDVGAGFGGGFGAIDLVGRKIEGRGSAGDADAAAGGEDGCAAEVAGALLRAQGVDQVLVDAYDPEAALDMGFRGIAFAAFTAPIERS